MISQRMATAILDTNRAGHGLWRNLRTLHALYRRGLVKGIKKNAAGKLHAFRLTPDGLRTKKLVSLIRKHSGESILYK